MQIDKTLSDGKLTLSLIGRLDTIASPDFQEVLLAIFDEAAEIELDFAGLEYDPVVSPDGRWLVFCSEPRVNPNLFLLDLQRGGEPRLRINSERRGVRTTFGPI